MTDGCTNIDAPMMMPTTRAVACKGVMDRARRVTRDDGRWRIGDGRRGHSIGRQAPGGYRVDSLPLTSDRRLCRLLSEYDRTGAMQPPSDVLRGTLDLLILKTLTLEPMHGWGISQRIQQFSRG